MYIIDTAITFFLVTNPIGNSPTILAITKDYDFHKQRWILFREGIFALFIAIFFQYFGEVFLNLIQAKDYTLTLCGGILLFLLSLVMIFPKAHEAESPVKKQEPYIVPIATPLLSGPGLMSIIMIQAKLSDNNFLITGALLISFAGVMLVLLTAPYIQKVMGKKGLLALEQLMGLVLSLIAMEMIVSGVLMFIQTLKVPV